MTNKKLYPICNYENNQHKLYYLQAYYGNRQMFDEEDAITRTIVELEEAPLDKKGTAYGSYDLYVRVRNIINDYDAMHIH